ncbi:hypothetical protein HWX30_20690 [Ralstonia pickettii]|nr:hypothetical protein [Ralstonia pickettii]
MHRQAHFLIRRRVANVAAWLAFGLAASSALADVGVGAALPPSPDKLYGDLFVAVQTAQVYPDQKTFGVTPWGWTGRQLETKPPAG